MEIKLLRGKWIQGKDIMVSVNDDGGRVYIRTVRFRSDCGLYIVIKNRMYFEYECDYSEVYK